FETTISFTDCVTQIFCTLLLGATESFLLSAMAYDRYTAVCHPLHYITIMNKAICSYLVLGAWIIGLFFATINTVPTFGLQFCGLHEINHFSCELPPLLKASCSDTFLNNWILLSSVLVFGLGSFLPILVSYVQIISAILKMPSMEDRSKAFSTCSSHLFVVGLFYVSGFFRYMKPTSGSSSELDIVVSIQYSILTPMLNPIIYSLKNKDMKMAMRKIMQRFKI
ncbi:olfactory receptor 10A3-like, partial [Liasis olivaceus]